MHSTRSKQQETTCINKGFQYLNFKHTELGIKKPLFIHTGIFNNPFF
jgi:hypothetical protein